ncbi:MAG: calcium-binding protein [Pseudomonadota bacterium]
MPNLIGGTGVNDTLIGSVNPDIVVGLAGDDVITGDGENDSLFGDYTDPNLFDGTSEISTFSGYAETGDWTVTDLDAGHQEMTQTVQTEIGGVYAISFSLAANFAAGRTNAAIEVFIDGTLATTVSTDSGAFSDYTLQFTATDSDAEITFRSIDTGENAQVINTDGPAFYTETPMVIGGETHTVAAFADGQSNLYQVLNGTLYVYDTQTNTYEKAGSDGTVNVNSMGFNTEDNLLYAIAVGNGVDSLGNTVRNSDLVMFDARGDSYRIGETPYRSWTGDFDDQGNLWSFEADMDRVAVIDVDTLDADGNPVTTIYKFDSNAITVKYYDLAFDASTQTFRGVTRPAYEGAATSLLIVDISNGAPEFSTIDVTRTVINGVIHDGVPLMTFGAAIYDADGNLYVGGNGGDHDMDNATGTSGAIYRVVIDEQANEAALVLMADAPKSYSNDGAADPTAESPFADIDLDSSVLLRDLNLVATVEGDLTYDDDLSGGGGADTVSGGIGDDTAFGGSAGDTLNGDDGDDVIYGGSGGSGSGIISVYDDAGNRFDQFGNPLAEDNDVISGGNGSDHLSGSAGHDMLDGGQGEDTLRGGSGNDTLYGGSENDMMTGGRENDHLYGQTGEDLLRGGSGDDVLDGGNAADVLKGGSGSDTLTGGAGDDDLQGGTASDVLDGGADNDTLKGVSGSDHLSGGSGADSLDGGSGNDTLDGGTGRDRLKGGSGNDVMNGNAGHDYLNGHTGNDTLDGGEGRDVLYLGAGDDVATGGENADRFVFRAEDLDGSSDVITDFSAEDGDRIDLRQLQVLEDGETAADWLAAHAALTATGGVDVDLGADTNLRLQNLGFAEATQIDGLLDSFLF